MRKEIITTLSERTVTGERIITTSIERTGAIERTVTGERIIATSIERTVASERITSNNNHL